jgi:RNA polymerase sigma factor (sigma-70 family)
VTGPRARRTSGTASPRVGADPVAEAFRAGDEVALADVYARWSPVVHSLALRSLGDVARAEEVTQRVFTRAWASRETFDPASTRLPDWLVGLARTCIADLRTAQERPGRSPAQIREEESVRSESKTDVLAERLMVAESMSILDTLSRRVLQMALDLVTPAEIAAQTGLRVDEVRSRIASSLMDLRQQLEPRDAR